MPKIPRRLTNPFLRCLRSRGCMAPANENALFNDSGETDTDNSYLPADWPLSDLQ